VAQRYGLGLGKVAQPLRVAVTGGAVSPPIDITLALLGHDRTLARIERAQRWMQSVSN
jgi:glutamyl-tRNA synthetase